VPIRLWSTVVIQLQIPVFSPDAAALPEPACVGVAMVAMLGGSGYLSDSR
jgi:hypothetical protein